MNSRSPWRLLRHPRGSGRYNMAVDEALLEHYARADPGLAPTLRLYGFSPATLSLGRHQPAAGAHDPGYLKLEGIDLVRRPTGGRAVLHEHERTYAVAGRLGGAAFPGAVIDSYRRIADSLVQGLALLGLQVTSAGGVTVGALSPRTAEPSCFSAPSTHEIVVERRKLIGSAQLRRRRAFLQHGSILIRSDPERLSAALGRPAEPASFTDLEALLSRVPTDEEIDRALLGGFERALGASFEEGALGPEETRLAERLSQDKYGDPRWTLEGRTG